MREIVVQNHGRPGREMSHQLTGSRERIITTGLIPASAFPATDSFYEGQLPNGVAYEVEFMSEDASVWDVWLVLPADPWLALIQSAEKAKALEHLWEGMLQEGRRQ